MMTESQVLIRIHTGALPTRGGWMDYRLVWEGPKVFEERLVSPDKAEELKNEWIRLSKFLKKDDLCEKCWDKVAPELCQGCKKYNHICCGCLESIEPCSKCYLEDADQFGDFMEVLPDIGDNTCEYICGYVHFNAMEFEIITDTKIIEAFKIVHPKGYVMSHPIIDELNRCQHRWKKYQLNEAKIRCNNYPDHNKLNGIYRDHSGVIYAGLNGKMWAIGFDVGNDGTIKLPTSSQLNTFMKDSRHSAANIPLNTKWRNGNNGPVSCDECLKMTKE